VTFDDGPKMEKLFGKGWNFFKVPENKPGGREMSMLYPPYRMIRRQDNPDTLSVSGALLVVFNTVKSGPHVVRETDQIDETPWAHMSGGWSFHGIEGARIAALHGTEAAEGLPSVGAALAGIN